jgi:hypothetical protein
MTAAIRLAERIPLPPHWRARELRLLGLILVTLLVIGAHLSGELERSASQGTGWRAIDVEALQRRIDAGDLRDREADWYHPARPDEVPEHLGRQSE